jgi:hypothetical protein
MASVFDSPAQINTIYDLKGSLIGRSATEKERASGGVLKDNDLIFDERKLHLGVKKTQFVAQLEKDAMFLASLNIMDYSLLVGIHDRQKRHTNVGHDNSVSNHFNNTKVFQSMVDGTASILSQQNVNMITNANSTPTNVTGRSNTPFRRSIHVNGTLDGKQNCQTSNLADSSINKDFLLTEENQNSCTDLSHKSSDSPTRKQVRKISSSSVKLIENDVDTTLSSISPKRLFDNGLLNDDSIFQAVLPDQQDIKTHSSLFVDEYPVRLKKTFSRGQDGLMISADKTPNYTHHIHQHVAHNTQHHSHAHHKQHIHQYIDIHRRRSSSSSHDNDQSGVDIATTVDRRGSGNSVLTTGSEVLFGHYVVRDDGENEMFDHEEGEDDDEDNFDPYDGESCDEDDEFDDCIDDGDSDCNFDDSITLKVNVDTRETLKGNESELTFTREIVREDGIV